MCRYISTLYAQEKWPEETVCEDLAAHLRKRFDTNVLRHFRPEFGDKMKKKQKLGQPVAFTDVFGMAIENALLQVDQNSYLLFAVITFVKTQTDIVTSLFTSC